MGIFDFLFKREKNKQIKKLSVIADSIEALEPSFSSLSDEALVAKTSEFKKRYEEGESLDGLLPEAFATVREASKRVLNMRHFYVQLIGGVVLHQGRIAEMQTGEGKTLVATLPAYLNSLSGKGVHIVTVNDYLAKRDSDWMGKIFKFLGLTVGVVLNDMRPEEKKAAYDADITYATNNEIGFDYLRDNMAVSKDRLMQRGHNFAIVDEVDSILIDEARTPLIISAQAGESDESYIKANKFVRILHEEDYIKDEKERHIYLSEVGVEKAENYFKIENLGDSENADLSVKINSALRANFLMHIDVDYIVEDGQIIIVDEFTGRKMAGRRYSDGLHQAIEAKENVRVNKENKTIATITFQNYFRLYSKLSGMTGTAITEEAEFNGIYKLDVVPVPTNLPCVRVDELDKIYLTKEIKFKNIIEDIKTCHSKGQPVLVGTTNVETSELLSDLLHNEGITHSVLNAKRHKEEAAIIAQAGCKNAVTIATNMAGRGTDILLGGNPEFLVKKRMVQEEYEDTIIEIASAKNHLTDETQIAARNHYNELLATFKKDTDAQKALVCELGGLRVIGTERHESRRIDNQLRGRSGRQGDPGSSSFYLSFEDDLLRLFGGDRMRLALASLHTGQDDMLIQMPLVTRGIESAQKRCEENNYERRKYVLNYDDVMNKQRQLIYSQRNEVLDGKDVHDQILKYMEPVIEEISNSFVNFSSGDETTIDYDNFNSTLELKILNKGTNIVTREMCAHLNYGLLIDSICDKAKEQYESKVAKAKESGIDFYATERTVLLDQVDRHWMNHIADMDALRKGIGLRGYAQHDPIMEYRREGSDMFEKMIDSIQTSTVIMLAKIDIEMVIERINAIKQRQMQQNAQNMQPKKIENKKVVGRNEPCPCGSGKKYKNCCGR
ncbi:MAG: preprotein translocase subunit SecA [Christensenellaceae bacterium]|jgi:preprotein translocase subunit SecA|nr:preprotein translocase subunit SecA [Christensenellaceae bacterium]